MGTDARIQGMETHTYSQLTQNSTHVCTGGRPPFQVCCDCTDGCRDPNICACLRLRAGKGGTVYQAFADGEGTGAAQGDSVDVAEGQEEGGGANEGPGRRRFYNDDGLLLHLPDAIFECGARYDKTSRP